MQDHRPKIQSADYYQGKSKVKSFKTAAVFAKRTEPMGEALKKLLSILKAQNVDYLLETSTAEHLPGSTGVSLEELGEKADVIIMLGGDGTTLGIARRMAKFKLPIIAINAGRLGFITYFSLQEMEQNLPPLLRGEYEVDTRAMLRVRVYRQGTIVFDATAVNDAGITHGRAGSMVEFNVWVDGHPMATQRSDGVIVSSATGSTAYAMAAGGPILHPALNAMVLVPVAPHALTNRPIVLPGSSTIDIGLIEAREASAYCDMQDFFPMQKGDILRVRTMPESFTILHPVGHNHYDTLRRKLYWNLMPSDNASLPIKD